MAGTHPFLNVKACWGKVRRSQSLSRLNLWRASSSRHTGCARVAVHVWHRACWSAADSSALLGLQATPTQHNSGQQCACRAVASRHLLRTHQSSVPRSTPCPQLMLPPITPVVFVQDSKQAHAAARWVGRFPTQLQMHKPALPNPRGKCRLLPPRLAAHRC